MLHFTSRVYRSVNFDTNVAENSIFPVKQQNEKIFHLRDPWGLLIYSTFDLFIPKLLRGLIDLFSLPLASLQVDGEVFVRLLYAVDTYFLIGGFDSSY